MDDQQWESFRTGMNRRFDSVAELMSRVVERIDARIDTLEHRMEQRFEALERHVNRIGDQMAGFNQQMAALSRWAEHSDRDATAVLSTQAAQQRAIDDLTARVTKLERRNGGSPPASSAQS